MKNILALANSRDLADEWIAKHGHLHRDKHHHQWFKATNTAELEYILKTYFYQGIRKVYLDVEGYILSDFQHNPERARMLELLISHKRKVGFASAEDFTKNVLLPNKEKLLQIQS